MKWPLQTCIFFCFVLFYRQPRRTPGSSYKQQSLDESSTSQPPSRRFSTGSKTTVIPRPPSTPHDRHHVVTTRILGPAHGEVSSLRQKRYTPSPPSSSNLTPSPPNSAKTNRPSSAARFRKRVVECRESGD